MKPVDIPMTKIGQVTVPRLFLGDHGFLAKLDSSMDEADIYASIARMLALAGVGVAAGETRVVNVARTAITAANRRCTLMIHGDLPVILNRAPIRYRNCAATLLHALNELGLDVRTDPVLCFLDRVGACGKVIDIQIRDELGLDDRAMATLLGDIRHAEPDVVTIGGDWLDMLLLVGRHGLVVTGLQQVSVATKEVGASLVLATYVGALIELKTILEVTALVDGIMVPLNRARAAMLPNENALWSWITAVGKPVIAMHVLAGGDDPLTALRYLLAHPEVAVAVIGASSPAHQDVLAGAAGILFPEESP